MDEYKWEEDIKDDGFGELIHQNLITHTTAEFGLALKNHYIDQFKSQSIGSSLTNILKTTKDELNNSLDSMVRGMTLISLGINKLNKNSNGGKGAGYINVMNESVFTPPGLKRDAYILDVLNKFTSISENIYDITEIINNLDTTMSKFLADEDFRTQLLSDGTDVGKEAKDRFMKLNDYFNSVTDTKVVYESRKIHEVLRNEEELDHIKVTLLNIMKIIDESNINDIVKLMKKIDKKGNIILKELDKGDRVTKAAMEAMGNEIIHVANYITITSKVIFFMYALERSYLDIKSKI